VSGYLAGFAGLWAEAVPHISEPVNPAAGAGYTLQLDGRYWWRLHGATFTLGTDSNAANRLVTVQYGMADLNPLVIGEAALVVVASTTALRFVGSVDRGDSEWNSNTDVMFPLTNYPILGGRPFQIAIANAQAGDTLTAIKLAWWRLPTARSVVEQFAGEPGS
jgi:hypothetical protein